MREESRVLKAPARPTRAPSIEAPLVEAQLAELHRAMRTTFGPRVASTALAEAGRRAAAELLRAIPLPERERRLSLPRTASTAMLLAFLRRHSGRFAAERRFTARGGTSPVLIIAANPLCDPPTRGERVCAWHEALFETLFQALVSPGARVRETTCLAQGDAECRFEVTFEEG